MPSSGKKRRLVVLVQARMGSTRLPGKHLKTVLGRSLLEYLVERLKRVKKADLVVIATTTNPKDDVLARFCEERHIACFRGSEEDVLQRFVEAAHSFDADMIVRICADCPLIDPEIIDRVIEHAINHPEYTLVTNVLTRSYPRGMDVEVFSRESLEKIAEETDFPEDREHVTAYFYKHPARFQVGSVAHATDESLHRWTVDTEMDFQLISKLIEAAYPQHPNFSLDDLLGIIRAHPEWSQINEKVSQKKLESVADQKYSLALVRPLEDDARLLLEWRNDPETRQASFHTALKDWSVYYETFQREFFNFPDFPPLFVVLAGEKVAFLRLEPIAHPIDTQRSCCKISINVAPKKRGEGIGVQSLLLAKEFLRMQGVNDAYAEVKVGNQSSEKAFEKAGFKLFDHQRKVVFDTGESVEIRRFLASLCLTPAYVRKSVYVIAEAGSNWWTGSNCDELLNAKRLIEVAAKAGANAVKFQIFRPESIYVENAGKADYLSQSGDTSSITDLFKSLTMPHAWIPLLAKHAQEKGIEFMATAFSVEDFNALDPYVKRHKIASYEIGHLRLLECVAKSGKPVILSTGASTEEDVAWAVAKLRELGVVHLTLLQCTACYPAPSDSLNLRTIPFLQERFDCPVGLSDHSASPLIAPLGAVALGATTIEKHFTLDKTLQGPDHAFAVSPEELSELVRTVRELEPMLGAKAKLVDQAEDELRLFAKRGIQVIRPIKKGDLFRENINIAILRPGKQLQGIHPLFLPVLEGKPAKRGFATGEGIQLSDLE